MSRSDEPFLSRWSRLKRATPQSDALREVPEAQGPEGTRSGTAVRHGVDTASPSSKASGDSDSVDAQGRAGEDAAAAAKARYEQLAAIDIDALDYSSDFTPFMQDGVPDELRNKALRKLWSSDPVFGVIDGLDDYCEDFSDAVWVTPDLKTAYKVGQGFLTDEEAAVWDRLGKPEAEIDAAADAGPDSTAPEADAGEAPVAASASVEPPGEVGAKDAGAGAVAGAATAGAEPANSAAQADDEADAGAQAEIAGAAPALPPPPANANSGVAVEEGRLQATDPPKAADAKAKPTRGV